jgi:DNA polymerase-3 subunit delta'
MQLPDLMGNRRLKRDLAALRRSTFPTAVSIDGDFGIGKRTAARGIAQALLCKEENGPCGVCGPCRRFLAGSHPDFFLFNEEEKDTRVDDVRDLRTRSFIKPSEAPHKVFVICGADRMNPSCQNALLKVLEEPASSVFILLCRNRESLLQTVRSRCIHFRMEPLTEPELRQALLQREPDVPADRLQDAIRHCGGSLGLALDLVKNGPGKGFDAAREFVSALDRDELAIYAACLPLGSLSREEYGSFCDEACRLLLMEMKDNRKGPAALSVSEYLQKQKDSLSQNPSPTALSGALAAFCGSFA